MFVEGFVVGVKADRKEEYLKFARIAAQVFLDNGAVRYVENWGTDVKPGKQTSFPQAIMAEEDEVVVFSWIEFPDKPTRDACFGKAMSDPRMAEMGMPPFDGARMIMGGFETISDMKA